MRHHSHKDKTERFLIDFEETSPTVMLGLMVISLGLYSIIWIYITNKQLEDHDKHAPESSRGISVMAILPLIWFFLTSLIENKLLTTSIPLLYTILKIGVWGFIFFLIIKFLMDFVQSFTNITKSQPFIWNSLNIIGIIGLLGLILHKPYMYPFLIGIIFSVIGMQTELNSLLKSHNIKKVGSNYYK